MSSFHLHCWHHVASRGDQDVYACCGLVPTGDPKQSQLCGSTLLPRAGVGVEEKTHGIGILYMDEMLEFAREAVKRASEA